MHDLSPPNALSEGSERELVPAGPSFHGGMNLSQSQRTLRLVVGKGIRFAMGTSPPDRLCLVFLNPVQ